MIRFGVGPVLGGHKVNRVCACILFSYHQKRYIFINCVTNKEYTTPKAAPKKMQHLVTHLLLLHLLMRGALTGDGRRRVLHLPGDLLLGGLFPMHEQVRDLDRDIALT